MLTAVIFDFDGVLADTEPLHLGAFQDVFATRGWTLDARAYFDRYLGYDDRGLVDVYAADHALRLTPAEIDRLLAQKSAAFRARLSAGDVLAPGAAACIARLGGFALGVATGSLRAEVVDILSASGMLAAFRAIVAADDVKETKPAPEPYLTAAARLGVAPARCVAVEDSVWGLTSASAAGMRTIGITTTSPRAALAGADRIVERLDDLTPALIDSLL